MNMITRWSESNCPILDDILDAHWLCTNVWIGSVGGEAPKLKNLPGLLGFDRKHSAKVVKRE